MKLFFCGLLVCASISLRSQTCDSTTQASPGTYEIRHIAGSTEANEFIQRPLTVEELCLIESQRQPNRVVTIRIDDFTEVRIFPKEGL